MAAPVEERVAYLEGRVEEQTHMINGIREAIVHLEERMDRRFEGVERRFEGIDTRFAGIDRRFEALESRIDALDRKLDRRTDALDEKLSSHFVWLVGVQVTTFVAIVAAVLAR